MSDKNKHYVNLHAHSGFSIGDGLGDPSKHIDFAIQNKLKAHAFTDHGVMSGMANAELHMKKIREKNPDFKVIRGVEAYFVPSLKDWHEMKNKFQEQEEVEDDEVGTVVENEDETKKGGSKVKNQNQRELRRRGHLVLLAKNQIGLKNLYSLTSKSFSKDNFYYYPRIDFDLLKKHSEGLIISNACLGSAVTSFSGFWDWVKGDSSLEADVLKKQTELCRNFQQIFKENFFLELQWNAVPEQHLLNKNLIDISKNLGIPLISTADCHYPDPKLWKQREVYKKLAQLGKSKELTLDDLPASLDKMPYELYPKNADQMIEAYERYSKQCGFYYDDKLIHDSIFRTGEIADSIENYKINTKIQLPTCFTPKGKTAGEHLREICEKTLHEKNLADKPEYKERLDYELSVIDERGMNEYFLTKQKVVEKAKETGLTGVARGSAGGCIISYLTGITQIDPVKFDLQFERFITVDDPESYPDIDSDFEEPAELRNKLAEDWKTKYNLDVVQISNYNTLKLRNLLKDIAKLLDVPFQEVNDVTNKVFAEATKPAKIKHDVESGMYEPNYEDALEFSPSFNQFLKKYPVVGEYLKTLSGEKRNVSAHAAGTVIAENLTSNLPLIAAKGNYQTPFAEGQRVRELEPMGFLKFDFLGLSTLRMIHRAIELIIEKQLDRKPNFAEVKEFYETKLHPDVLNLDDQKVYENVYHDGKWVGIFQFAQRPVQQFCKRVKPRSISELSDVTAIYRPGPLAAGVDKKYLEEEEFEHMKFQVMKEVFGPSKGHLIYQETIAKFASKVGDYSLGDGNKLRKLLTKKGIGDTKEKLQKFKDRIVLKGQEKGVSKRVLESLWHDIERSSQYLFNRCLAFGTTVEIRKTLESETEICEIQNVYPGWFVNSENGFVKVLNVFNQGEKHIVTVKLLSGEMIECTLDHKFQTEFGMLPLHKIYQDRLKVKTKNNGWTYLESIDIDEALFYPNLTFDLEVDHPDHTFYANGISVSNSHSIGYSIISYQCAWLLTYHPLEWCCAFLDKEPIDRKEAAIATVKTNNFEIGELDLNKSDGYNWTVVDGKLIPPLASVKGLGDAAISELLIHRSFKTIDQLIGHPYMDYRKFSKKGLDALARSGALNFMIDSRFSGTKHFWASLQMFDRKAAEKKKAPKFFKDFIEEAAVEFSGNFNKFETINNTVEITGVYPVELVATKNLLQMLENKAIPPISEYDPELQAMWLIPREVIHKKTGKGKDYYIVKCTDINSTFQEIKVWGVDITKDLVYTDRIYVVKPNYDETWGFSTNGGLSRWRLMS